MERKDYRFLCRSIHDLANPEKAKKLQSFFKTGKGEYGEGDIFIGIVVPEQRKLANQFVHLSYSDLQLLLDSKIHEERLIALLILVRKYEKNEEEREDVFKFYLSNSTRINNWDLVDLSAPKIVGPYLLTRNKDILYSFAKSLNLWERRIAIVSTYWFIKNDLLKETLKISALLLQDKHDLIHKAAGWMLREVGKKDKKLLIDFLNKNYKIMPRTMLRYAIEKMDEKQRQEYLIRS